MHATARLRMYVDARRYSEEEEMTWSSVTHAMAMPYDGLWLCNNYSGAPDPRDEFITDGNFIGRRILTPLSSDSTCILSKNYLCLSSPLNVEIE